MCVIPSAIFNATPTLTLGPKVAGNILTLRGGAAPLPCPLGDCCSPHKPINVHYVSQEDLGLWCGCPINLHKQWAYLLSSKDLSVSNDTLVFTDGEEVRIT